MARRRTPRGLRRALAENRLAFDKRGEVSRVLAPAPAVQAPGSGRMECAHGKPIHHCGKCSKEGEQYEVDRKVEELAGGVEPEEWLMRGRKFQTLATSFRLSLGRTHPETRAATQAAKQCMDLAKALLDARKTRDGRPPSAPKPLIHTPGGGHGR